MRFFCRTGLDIPEVCKVMQIRNLAEVAEQEPFPGFHAKFVHSANVTVSYWNVKAGAVLPEHAHPHEQISNILAGEFELVVDGESCVLTANSVAVIPPGAKHSGRALTACRIIDVFYPVREDYRERE
jgi:quercetin dioxygenase-like cupin family protein